jgi:heme-degrading monooxygenase HmoA
MKMVIDEFEAALLTALHTLMPRAKGMLGWTVERCVEEPGRYMMRVQWDTIEDHMVGYRQSDLSPQFKALVMQFFIEPPEVVHFEAMASHDGKRT